MYDAAMIEGYLSTKQASEKFGPSSAHIRRLLEHETMRCVKIGHDRLLEVASSEGYLANRPMRGRKPNKAGASIRAERRVGRKVSGTTEERR